MEITVKLFKSEIMHEVMNETYVHGNSAYTGDNNEKVYNMQASEEDAHVNKLLRSMQSSIEELKSNLSSFLKSGSDTSADNIQQSLGGDDDTINIILEVTSRFNKAYTPTIANLAHRFVVNKMLFEWYNTVEAGTAKTFYELCATNIAQIKASFFKMPPTRPSHKNDMEQYPGNGEIMPV